MQDYKEVLAEVLIDEKRLQARVAELGAGDQPRLPGRGCALAELYPAWGVCLSWWISAGT